LCDVDVHYEDPFCPYPLIGAAAIAAHAGRLWAAFPDARLNATGPRLGDEAHAAAPARVLGTHQEPIAGLAATGRSIDVAVVFFCQLRNGRLFRVRGFLDAYDVAMQLGVLPQPGTAGERALRMLRGFGLRRA
jgi:steroid delta-isomerase-like uncharacterized protein